MKAENENRLRRAGVCTRETCVHRNAVRGDGRKAGDGVGKEGRFFPKVGEGFWCAFLRERYAVEHCLGGTDAGAQKMRSHSLDFNVR